MSNEKTVKGVDFVHESTLDAYNAGLRYGERWDDWDSPCGGFRQVEPARDHWEDNAEARRNSKHEELDGAAFELGYRLAHAAKEPAKG